MPKNKFGGKHKHQKSEQNIVERFDFVEIDDDDLAYAYVSKAYGNRMFDIVLLKDIKTIKIKTQFRKRRSRISVGNLVTVGKSTDFTEDFYVVDRICGDIEKNLVQKSQEYSLNFKKITNEYSITNDSSDIYFEYGDDDDDHDGKQEATFEDSDQDSDEDSDQDLDNL